MLKNPPKSETLRSGHVRWCWWVRCEPCEPHFWAWLHTTTTCATTWTNIDSKASSTATTFWLRHVARFAPIRIIPSMEALNLGAVTCNLQFVSDMLAVVNVIEWMLPNEPCEAYRALKKLQSLTPDVLFRLSCRHEITLYWQLRLKRLCALKELGPRLIHRCQCSTASSHQVFQYGILTGLEKQLLLAFCFE